MRTKLSDVFSSFAFFFIVLSLVPGIKLSKQFNVLDDLNLSLTKNDIEIW